jgi:two-component system response regulator HydG
MLGDEGECRVLITGETGTGKENIARLIHASSWRMDKPFIAFNCAELSPQLLEGKLFGYMKGAFTGAEKTHTGVFESANDGTLFLDEVAELSPVAQAGLLRVLQEGRFMPLGGEKEVEVNVRVLAATNQPLKAMMKAGKFREDLYYRLNAVILHLPPLRERKEDIEAIAWGYWKRRPTPEQLQVLCSYSWPGNVRELLSILDRARIFKKEDSLSEVMPAEESGTSGTKDESLKSAIRAHVHKIHTRHEQNNTRAAKALGISINTLKKHLGITV